jgi:hypothetical protein
MFITYNESYDNLAIYMKIKMVSLAYPSVLSVDV